MEVGTWRPGGEGSLSLQGTIKPPQVSMEIGRDFPLECKSEMECAWCRNDNASLDAMSMEDVVKSSGVEVNISLLASHSE